MNYIIKLILGNYKITHKTSNNGTNFEGKTVIHFGGFEPAAPNPLISIVINITPCLSGTQLPCYREKECVLIKLLITM